MMQEIIDYIMADIWLSSLAIFIGFFVISKLFVWITEKIIIQFTKKTKTDLDDKIIHAVNNPISILLVAIGLLVAAERIDAADIFNGGFEGGLFWTLDRILLSFVIAFSALIFIRIADILIDHFGGRIVKKTASEVDDQILGIARKTTNIILWIIAFLYILSQWGIDVRPYLASLGIAGIIVGLAVKDILANIFGGVALIIDGSITAGDKVRLESGHTGVVTEISLRSTKIRTFDNELLIVPNAIMSNTRVHNYALPTPHNRVIVPFSVAYGTDPEKVERIVMKVLMDIPDVITVAGDYYPSVKFLKMAESCLEFEAWYWVPDYTKAFAAKLEGIKRIYKALGKNKIHIPFPQLDVHLKK